MIEHNFLSAKSNHEFKFLANDFCSLFAHNERRVVSIRPNILRHNRKIYRALVSTSTSISQNLLCR